MTCFEFLIATVPTKTQLSNFLGTPGEDYFKGNPKSLNFYFLVIWWGKANAKVNIMTHAACYSKVTFLCSIGAGSRVGEPGSLEMGTC